MCPFYSTMSISTRLSFVLNYLSSVHIVLIYLFTAICSVHIVTNHGRAEYQYGFLLNTKNNTMSKWHGLYALVQVITNRLCYHHTPVSTPSQHRTSLSTSASHREKYAPAAQHYGATMPACYNIVLLFMLVKSDPKSTR